MPRSAQPAGSSSSRVDPIDDGGNTKTQMTVRRASSRSRASSSGGAVSALSSSSSSPPSPNHRASSTSGSTSRRRTLSGSFESGSHHAGKKGVGASGNTTSTSRLINTSEALIVLTAVLEGAFKQPLRPFSEVFSRPQFPQRDMYQYRIFVNLLWYSKNYMYLFFSWALLAGLAHPYMLLNVGIFFILRTLSRLMARLGREEKELIAARDHRLRKDEVREMRKNIQKAIATMPGASAVKSSLKRRAPPPLGLGELALGTVKSKATDGKDIHSNTSSRSNSSGSTNSTSSSCAKGDKDRPKSNGKPERNIDGKTLRKLPISHLEGSLLRVRKTYQQVKVARYGVKFLQLCCCLTVFYTYGLVVPILIAVLPVMLVAAHSVLTPYTDEHTALFELRMAKKASGTVVEAPSTPVLSFEPNAFQNSREEFEREQERKRRDLVDDKTPQEVSPFRSGIGGLQTSALAGVGIGKPSEQPTVESDWANGSADRSARTPTIPTSPSSKTLGYPSPIVSHAVARTPPLKNVSAGRGVGGGSGLVVRDREDGSGRPHRSASSSALVGASSSRFVVPIGTNKPGVPSPRASPQADSGQQSQRGRVPSASASLVKRRVRGVSASSGAPLRHTDVVEDLADTLSHRALERRAATEEGIAVGR